jgi:hypothetical protein
MSLLDAVRRHARLPAEGHLPGFDGATGWLNSRPLTTEYLPGRVVLVDFWTYTCINWLVLVLRALLAVPLDEERRLFLRFVVKCELERH